MASPMKGGSHFALIGIRLRFHQSAGVLDRLGLALSVVGCAGVMVSVLAHLLLSGAAPEGKQHTWVIPNPAKGLGYAVG